MLSLHVSQPLSHDPLNLGCDSGPHIKYLTGVFVNAGADDTAAKDKYVASDIIQDSVTTNPRYKRARGNHGRHLAAGMGAAVAGVVAGMASY